MKYFKEEEFACPCCGENKTKQILMLTIDQLRDAIGQPLTISSAFRCPKHNEAVGGKSDSAHLKGLAVDIVCENSHLRFLLIKHALKLGFVRIGVDFKKFVHLDIDGTKPTEVFWGY